LCPDYNEEEVIYERSLIMSLLIVRMLKYRVYKNCLEFSRLSFAHFIAAIGAFAFAALKM
jgi:hypothetical protein